MGVWGAAIQGVLSVDSNITEGIAARKQTLANVAMADEAGQDALRRGGLEASQMRAAGTQLVARQNVAYGASGVDTQSGTPADVMRETSGTAELNALTIENNAAREAWGYKKHGIAFQTQAGIDSSRRNRETAGSIIGDVGQGLSAYAKDKAAGGNGFGFGT